MRQPKDPPPPRGPLGPWIVSLGETFWGGGTSFPNVGILGWQVVCSLLLPATWGGGSKNLPHLHFVTTISATH